MGTLTYPFTLTAGQPENVNQLNSNLTAIKTLLNGSVDGVNAPTFGQAYRNIASTTFTMSGQTAGLYIPVESGGVIANSASFATQPIVFTIDPADFAITGMSTKYRLRVATLVNSIAPAMNFTFGVHNVTSVAGAAGLIAVTANATAVTSSTVTLTTPSSSTGNTSVSSQFSAPASGFYTIGVTTSGTMAANSYVAITATLQAVNS